MLRINNGLQRIVGQNGPLRRLFFNILVGLESAMLGTHKDQHLLQLIDTLRRERESLLTLHDIYMLYSTARAQSLLQGDLAEVGVYQGVSARVLCEAKGDRVLHLFDTFEGLPEPSGFERTLLAKSQFECELDSVRKFLEKYDKVKYYKGVFQEASKSVEELRFSFVHFDVDLYESTLDCLRFFYPRMVPGGVIISHDYSVLEGVKRAFDEFFHTSPERVIDLPTTQCMVLIDPVS